MDYYPEKLVWIISFTTLAIGFVCGMVAGIFCGKK